MPYGIGQSNPPWGDEDVARLTELQQQGLSASEIGAAMRRSRNAIIGKITRLGLRGPRSNPQPKPDSEVTARTRIARRKREQNRSDPKLYVRVWNKGDHEGMVTASIGRHATDLLDQETANSVPFHALGPSHCRWPVSGHGLEIMFCGAPHCDNLSYCPEHYRKAYIKPTRSRTVIHWNFR